MPVRGCVLCMCLNCNICILVCDYQKGMESSLKVVSGQGQEGATQVRQWQELGRERTVNTSLWALTQVCICVELRDLIK